jgi:hypothetical protein
MDAGEMAGLGGAAGAVGQGLGQLAQDQFTDQTNAANEAQKAALAAQAQKAESDRQQAGFANTNQNEQANRDQRATFHTDDFGLKATMDQHTMDNQDTNTDLRASEVASGNAEKAQSIAASQAKTPAEVAELTARAKGIDQYPSGVTPVMVSTAAKEYEQANKDAEAASKAYQASSKHLFTPEQKAAAGAAQTALQQANQRAQDARARLDSYSGVTDGTSPSQGIAPAASPTATPKAATSPNKAWNDARLSVPVGSTYTGPDGQQYVRGS